MLTIGSPQLARNLIVNLQGIHTGAYKPYVKRYEPMHEEALKIRKGCIQFDIVDKPYANRCQTQTDTVQTLLRSVRYLSHYEAEACKPYANEGKTHKRLSEFCVIGVHPI